MKTRGLTLILLFAGVFVACVVSVLALLQRNGASDLFTRYVLDPIPESVARIRADQPKTLGGYGYTFRFEIDRPDLSLILQSRPLRRLHRIAYTGRVLDWDWSPSSGVMMSPYGHGWWPREPKWFADLGTWRDDVEAYALEQEQEGGTVTEVLIYNPALREAIFVTFKMVGM